MIRNSLIFMRNVDPSRMCITVLKNNFLVLIYSERRRLTKTCMWFELKTRRLEKSGVFILLKACPTGFFHGKTASPKFQFSSPGRRTWGIFNPCNVGEKKSGWRKHNNVVTTACPILTYLKLRRFQSSAVY